MVILASFIGYVTLEIKNDIFMTLNVGLPVNAMMIFRL
jgi:hypothetical protein